MNVFQFKDLKPKPDIVHEYSRNIRKGHVPILIDNGSFACRVGWGCDENPRIVFRNLIAKPRKDRTKKDGEIPVTPVTQIGNDIINIEALRFQLKTQFDRNVVTHFHVQEQIFDYIFTHLAIDSDHKVDHPIIMTECFANPNYSRNLMSELLFECYDIPMVCYGVDSLFSFLHNMPDVANGLVISCGNHTTHVIPILNNKVVADKVRRINLGGFHMINFLHRVMQLKYPVHVNAITQSRIEELLYGHCSIAFDYIDKLKQWAQLDYYEQHVLKVQLPFNQAPSNVPVLTADQKLEKKRDLARRLTEINARRREEKLAEDEDQLNILLNVRELYEEDEEENEEFEDALKENQIEDLEELEKLITTISSKIEKTKTKMANLEVVPSTPIFTTPVEEKIPQPPLGIPIEIWVAEVKRKRISLVDKRNARKQRRQDLAKRHTVAAQERMRIISQLAKKEKGTDDFGMRDEDWDIYKSISKDGDSDSDAENEKLIEYEMILRHHDPTFEEQPQITQSGIAENHQLHFGVEQQRGPELLFQPSMIGSSEAGLVETINYVLNMFPAEDQLLLSNNIFLTGGSSKFVGLKERLSREMTEIRPFQTTHKITVANDPVLDTWYGMKKFSNENRLETVSVTKQSYHELGGEYVKDHFAGNEYHYPPSRPEAMFE